MGQAQAVSFSSDIITKCKRAPEKVNNPVQPGLSPLQCCWDEPLIHNPSSPPLDGDLEETDSDEPERSLPRLDNVVWTLKTS